MELPLGALILRGQDLVLRGGRVALLAADVFDGLGGSGEGGRMEEGVRGGGRGGESCSGEVRMVEAWRGLAKRGATGKTGEGGTVETSRGEQEVARGEQAAASEQRVDSSWVARQSAAAVRQRKREASTGWASALRKPPCRCRLKCTSSPSFCMNSLVPAGREAGPACISGAADRKPGYKAGTVLCFLKFAGWA
jgi:hypothetical protein